jgi:DNA polymerase-3 subunit gamma/tau
LQLKEAKNSAAISFEMALLRIKDDNSFEAVTADHIQKQFIEQDRNKLFAFLQERLQNRLLQFNVIVEEKAEGKQKMEISLTAKEQFLKMAEQYPMVKELKDRLRLELDY